MDYKRNGMFSVKTPQGTPLRLITSSIAVEQQWLTLDRWACPLNNNQKDWWVLKKQQVKKKQWNYKKKNMASFYGWGSTASRLKPLWQGSLLYNTKFLKILILILSTSEGWKAELILEPPNVFDHETPGLGIQHLYQ